MGGESERPYCWCSDIADKVKGCHGSPLEPEPNLTKTTKSTWSRENQLKKKKKKEKVVIVRLVIRSQNI